MVSFAPKPVPDPIDVKNVERKIVGAGNKPGAGLFMFLRCWMQ